MATLTGFKPIKDQQQGANAQVNGQQNPVFVFDDVDGNATSGEEFMDATSQSSQTNGVTQSTDHKVTPSKQQQRPKIQQHTDAPSNQQTQHNHQEQSHNNVQHDASSTTPSSKDSNHKQTDTSNSSGSDMQNHSTSPQQQRVKQSKSTDQLSSLSPDRAAGRPIGGQDGDNKSLSMLAIDCVGTGKSPRSPRRSPLMALFRGKPRESVRRTYTDEDQFEIEWANLSLEVQKKWYQKVSLSALLTGADNKPEKPRMILNGVDGRIKSGEITAVLGPSGAGKTSLLNSLFGKYRTSIQGSIKVTGAPSKKHLTVCTIPQSDFLIGTLTTEESLWFASRLKNCEDDFNHDRNIERVIELLGLQRCRHTRINKLSGGQYKRVSIAQEMLSSPDILVLDEPTSGLDSLTCYRTVKVLRDLVEASKAHNLVNPMSIILTIHQPHREVLDLFHSVYVMAVGGQTLFQGAPAEMDSFIEKYSGTTMPTEAYNPASFMVELASEEYGRQPIDALVAKQRERFRATTRHKYDSSDSKSEKDSLYGSSNNIDGNKKGDSTITLYPLNGNSKDKYFDVDLGNSGSNNVQTSGAKDIDSRIMTPRSGKNSDGVFWRHVNLMSKRCFLSNSRDPLLCTIRVGAHIFIPLIVALIYGPRMGIPNGCPFYKPEINLLEYASMGVEEIQEKHDDIRIQFQNVGLHFMVYYAFGLCMLAFTAISFPLIMHVLVKEIRNGWYSLGTFIIGKMLAELPMALTLPPISVAIIYIMTGQPASYLHWRYMVQSLILILIVMIAEAKGLIFGAICMNSMQTAVFAASVSTVPFILLSGFLIRISEVPYILQHFARFSYFKHSVEALIITRYGFGMCPCDPALIPPGGTPRIMGIPPQIMSLTDYYINAYVSNQDKDKVDPQEEQTNVAGNNRNVSRIIESVTTLSPDVEAVETSTEDNHARSRRQAADDNSTSDSDDSEKRPIKQGLFFDKLATLLTRANAFGFSILTCEDVEPFTMKDMRLKDHMLPSLIGYLFLTIIVMKFISYFIVDFCVKLKL